LVIEKTYQDIKNLPFVLTTNELALIMRYTPYHLRRLIKQNRLGIPYFKTGHRFLFRRDDVCEWLGNPNAASPNQNSQLGDENEK
jgi:excisionase family DNA binding protein